MRLRRRFDVGMYGGGDGTGTSVQTPSVQTEELFGQHLPPQAIALSPPAPVHAQDECRGLQMQPGGREPVLGSWLCLQNGRSSAGWSWDRSEMAFAGAFPTSIDGV